MKVIGGQIHVIEFSNQSSINMYCQNHLTDVIYLVIYSGAMVWAIIRLSFYKCYIIFVLYIVHPSLSDSRSDIAIFIKISVRSLKNVER